MGGGPGDMTKSSHTSASVSSAVYFVHPLILPLACMCAFRVTTSGNEECDIATPL
jgi:hypothetical protein